MKDRRPLQAGDFLFPPTMPPHFSMDDPVWSATYSWWGSETSSWDDILPRGGFIEDLFIATKGTETATSFAMWTALTTVASVLARDAYLDLYPVAWYPNLYVILVAPPGLAKKSTILNYGEKLLRSYSEFIEDENLRYKKTINIHTNRVTPEGLQDLLTPPPSMPSKRADIRDVYVDRGSQIALFISELSTFLGRQSYNIGMVSKLTDLYEGKSHDSDYTKKDGSQQLRDIYVNLIAATTPSDLESVIPEEAFGGGLMSRTIVVYEKGSARKHPLPIRISNGPTHDDLKKGLAWIAANAFGPYSISKEALQYYYTWYNTFKERLLSYDSVRVLSAARMDVLMIKLSLLIRAQRYQIGREIELQDLVKAQQILEKTYKINESATENVGASHYGKSFNRLKDYLAKKRQQSRRNLLQYFSKYMSSDEITQVLEQLKEGGYIDVYRDNKRHSDVTRTGNEQYVYVGDTRPDEEAYDGS